MPRVKQNASSKKVKYVQNQLNSRLCKSNNHQMKQNYCHYGAPSTASVIENMSTAAHSIGLMATTAANYAPVSVSARN